MTKKAVKTQAQTKQAPVEATAVPNVVGEMTVPYHELSDHSMFAIAHFASHAVANDEDGTVSYFAFNPGRENWIEARVKIQDDINSLVRASQIDELPEIEGSVSEYGVSEYNAGFPPPSFPAIENLVIASKEWDTTLIAEMFYNFLSAIGMNPFDDEECQIDPKTNDWEDWVAYFDELASELDDEDDDAEDEDSGDVGDDDDDDEDDEDLAEKELKDLHKMVGAIVAELVTEELEDIRSELREVKALFGDSEKIAAATKKAKVKTKSRR